MQNRPIILEFSDKLLQLTVHPLIDSWNGVSATDNPHNPENYKNLQENIKRWREESDTIKPQSHLNQRLLNSALPRGEFQRYKNIISTLLPNCKILSPPGFNLIKSLNESTLSLPEAFFLKQEITEVDYAAYDKMEEMEGRDNARKALSNGDFTTYIETILDTVLNKDGLEKLMTFFSAEMNISAKIFMNSPAFESDIPNIKSQALKENKAIACLVFFDDSKRHPTGFYFKPENSTLTSYMFDTTGLTLPAYPCGLRYTQSENTQLKKSIFPLLEQNEIAIGIMPINTCMSIQKDKFSCLIATMMFFQAMSHGSYEILETPGIVDAWGSSHFYKKPSDSAIMFWNTTVILYTTNYLPLFIGCQDILALLFMLDPLKQADILLPDIIKYQSDWQREYKTSNDFSSRNAYWQNAYLALLNWFNKCYLGQQSEFPDFEKLIREGVSQERTEKSNFEECLNKLSQNPAMTSMLEKRIIRIVNTVPISSHSPTFWNENNRRKGEHPTSEKNSALTNDEVSSCTLL